MGGFGLTGTYQFAPNKNAVSTPDDDTYSIGGTYKAGNIYAAATYIDTQQSNDNAAAQFLAKYTWNDFEFHGIYELDKGLITAQANNGIDGGTGGRDGSAQDDGADVWSVGATYTIGSNLIGADYGGRSSSDGKDGIANTADDIQSYDVWRVAAYHSFSKRTRVYGGYADTNYDDKGDDTVFSLGIRHNF
jgi:predicted porin